MARAKVVKDEKVTAGQSADTPSKKRKASGGQKATPKKKKAATEKLTAQDFEPSAVNLNERLTEPLLALAKEELELGNKFKGISIKNAALILQKYPKVIESGEDALVLKGIGNSIAKKIDDILANGAIRKSEDSDANEKLLDSIEALKKVYGVNGTLAVSLVREHNINSVVDLVSHQHLLDTAAKIGLKYFKDFQEPIPRSEVETILKAIQAEADKIGDTEIHECGQYARCQDPIEEIVVVVSSNEKSHFSNLVAALQKSGLVSDVVSTAEAVVKSVCIVPAASQAKVANEPVAAPSAPKKVFSIPKFSQIKHEAVQTPNLFAQRGSAPVSDSPAAMSSTNVVDGSHAAEKSSHFHRRLELRYCTKTSFPIFFTHLLGPASFFQHLQDVAQTKHYALTAKTLRSQSEGESSKNVPIGSEQDLFDQLGLEFVPYSDRASFQKPSSEK